MGKKWHGSGQVRRVHVHLPLHLLCAFGTMVRAPLLYRPCTTRTIGDRPRHRSIAMYRETGECLAWGRMDRPCSSR